MTHTDTVVLDVDGTLVDSTYHHALAWRRAFHAHEVTVAMWRVHRAIGMGGDRLVEAVAGADVERRLGNALRERWDAEYTAVEAEARPFAGAAELLAALRGRGWKVVLGSSGTPEHTRRAVDLLGGPGAVDGWTTSEDADTTKPAPDVLQASLAAVDGSAAICVGDSPYDVKAAGRLGWDCIGVRSGGFSQAELSDAGAVIVVDDVRALLDALDETGLRAPS
jgi:HAD superfamily hydrolase (TIGR01549 family)